VSSLRRFDRAADATGDQDFSDLGRLSADTMLALSATRVEAPGALGH
jgi:hypothetical protein